MSEFDYEPIRGLPERLPPGESLRWQGVPRWDALAIRAFHVRTVAIYFAILMLFAVVAAFGQGGPAAALQAGVWLLGLGVAAVGILALLAFLYARSTVYTITDRRVVIRFGVAVPMAVNLPFKSIEKAGLRVFPDGTGDIPLTLIESQKVSYLIMWPNVRPWHFLRVEPMLRALPDVEQAAQILGAALHAAAEDAVAESAVDSPPEPAAVTTQS